MNRVSIFLIGLGLCVLVIAILLMSAVPPISRDALTHHLAVPKLWIKNSSIDVIPYLPISYYPMNLNLLYLLPLLKGNDILPKYIHFLFGLGTAWMIYNFLLNRTSREWALAGGFVFLSLPVVVKLSISAYVDLGLVFFSWAAILYMLKWAVFPHKKKNLLLSAVFCGLGLGTKYNGLIALALLTLFVPLIYIRNAGRERYKVRRAIGYPILFVVVAATVCSPWLIRNYRLTGNPIHPLYSQRISGEDKTAEVSNQSMKPWLQRKLVYKENTLETALIPIRIFFQGQDDNPRLFDGKLNPILFLFPLILLVWKKSSGKQIRLEQAILFAFSFLFILCASFMVDMRIRYIAPAIPPLVVLTVFGIEKVSQWLRARTNQKIRIWGHWVMAATLGVFLYFNVNYVMNLFLHVNPIPFISGHIDRETYLRNKLPEYPAVEFANGQTDDDMNILALFLGKRLYYFDQPVVFGTQQFSAMVNRANDRMDLSKALHQEGFTHCMIGVANFEPWATTAFNEDQKKIIAGWLSDDCRLLYRKNGYAVLKLMPHI